LDSLHRLTAVQVSENYDFASDESPEYFDYDADRQGFSFPHIGSLSPIQLAQVPAPPLPLLLSPLEQLAEAAAALSPVEETPASPELVWPSPPTLTYNQDSPVSSITEEPVSTPSSWSAELISGHERSPSPIDYDNIPTPPGITQEELVRLEYIPGARTTLTPPSPRPLTPLPPAEEARLENQENIPPAQEAPAQAPPRHSPYHLLRQPECLTYTHPHQYLAVYTPFGVQERPLREVSATDPLEIPLARFLLQNPPWFPSVLPFRGAATHYIRVKPDHVLARIYNLSEVNICSRLVRHESAPGTPLGFIKYDFRQGIVDQFRDKGFAEKTGYEGSLLILAIYDFLDGRRIIVYGYLAFGTESIYVKGVAFHCEDLLRTYPGLFAYTLNPRLPVDPFVHVSVHSETNPL
jgi:hypothetical protein